MKKKAVLFLLTTALLLSACTLPHEHRWTAATCTEPETCSVCGAAQGEPLGHDWKEATCTEPETCARCGETQGEPLGHDWKEATCTEPETCARCGETQGEPLGHDWKEATCTEPEICSVCGETRGEPLGHDALPADYWTPSLCNRCGEELAPVLTPDFETYGLDRQIVGLNETVDYKTICFEDPSFSTVGKLTYTSYEVTPGDGKKLEVREGYEWRILKLEILFYDDNARAYGMDVNYSHEDYYDIRHHDDTIEYGDKYASFDVVYKGKSYSCLAFEEGGYGDWANKQCVFSLTACVQVPVGYDGVVFGMCDQGVEWPDGAYVFDVDHSGTVYFRMS